MFLLSSFAIIVYILTSVQSVDNTDTNVVGKHSKINEALWSKNQKFNTFLNKYDFHNNDLLMDESQVIENKDENPNDHTLKQLKNVLSKFLKKNKVSKRYVSGKLGKRQKNMKHHNEKRKNDAKWDNWTNWSACSVTCGKGRHIRWRHCKENCVEDIETEMQEKACQLPACPQKLFGLIKL